SSGTGILPFDSGVVLSTGNINDLVGPNSSDSTASEFGGAGDADLEAILNTDPGDAVETFDATTLTFQFTPTTDRVRFQFVFGSEEYNEFVGSEFNDVFAFILNGQNIALLPGTNERITINSVNGGNNEEDPPEIGRAHV